MDTGVSNRNMDSFQNGEGQEIDLIELVVRLWSKRMFIIKLTAVFIVLGLFVAIFSPKEYSASCTIVPQVSKKGVSSGLSSLASMAGISLGDIGSGESLSPMVYGNVMNNTSLLKELIATPVDFAEYDEPITLLDYYTNPEYKKVSVLGTIKKYTIGLPGLLLGAIFGKDDEDADSGAELDASLVMLSKEESDCIKVLKGSTGINIEDKKGYITLFANMPEPLAAAQVTERMVSLLQKYVTEFKVQKAAADNEFITKSYNEAKEAFMSKQEQYAKFKDANRSISTAVAATRDEHLRNEYNLAYSLYSELAKQKLQSEIKVKEDTPIFTIIEPVTVPLEKSKPRRAMILVAFAFLGGVLSCGLVLGLDYLKKNFEIKYLDKWN